MITVFTNANILDVIGETTIKNGSVLVEDGTIKEVGANIAVEAESAGQKAVEADENLSQAEMVAVGAQSDTLMEVAAGTSDVAVIDAVMAYASVGEGTSYSDLVVVDGIELGKEEYGIGFRKGSNLVEAVNTALQELTDEGVLDELQQKYPSVLVTLEKSA